MRFGLGFPISSSTGAYRNLVFRGAVGSAAGGTTYTNILSSFSIGAYATNRKILVIGLGTASLGTGSLVATDSATGANSTTLVSVSPAKTDGGTDFNAIHIFGADMASNMTDTINLTATFGNTSRYCYLAVWTVEMASLTTHTFGSARNGTASGSTFAMVPVDMPANSFSISAIGGSANTTYSIDQSFVLKDTTHLAATTAATCSAAQYESVSLTHPTVTWTAGTNMEGIGEMYVFKGDGT